MKRTLGILVPVALLAVAPWVISDFGVSLLNYIGLSALVCLGLVLLTGVAGITTFGNATFAGIGAYTTAYLTTAYGVSPWLTLLIGLAITLAFSVLIGLLTLNLSGHFLPLSTVAWGVSAFFFLGNVEQLGGHTGIASIPSLVIFGLPIDDPRRMSYLIWGIVLLSMLLLHNLLGARIGRAVRAMHGGALMAETFGVNVPRTKLVAFVYSAVLACISGWLYAHLLGFVSPTPFGIWPSIMYLFMIYVGGATYLWGAIAGAAVLTILPVLLQNLAPVLGGRAGDFEVITLGLLMIVLFLVAPEGITGWLGRFVKPRQRVQVPQAALAPESAVVEPSAAANPAPGEVLLEARGLTKQFGGLTAVGDFSFEVRAGELVGLIGPNGAGKSTTFDMISCVTRPTSGTVLVAGEDMTKVELQGIAARGVARTFQHVRLLPSMSVIENVMLGAHRLGRSGVIAGSFRLNRVEEQTFALEARRQLERVGLGDKVHEPAGNLSLGQQRLLEIARALAAKPRLLLLDEPAAGLRYLEKQSLAQLLQRLQREGMTIVLVEHDMGFLMNLVDRVIVMNFGQKIAEGSPAKVRTDKNVLDAYLGASA